MVLTTTSAQQAQGTPSSGVTVLGRLTGEFAQVLTPPALEFLAALHREFERCRRELLMRRDLIQDEIDGGHLPRFLDETREIRETDWTVAPIPKDLLDRRVEITGPVDRKTVVGALNSGANVYMADFEDSSSPTWRNVVAGQINLRDAVARTIRFADPGGEVSELKAETATLFVRPRGWHLAERHVLVDRQPISGALFDFGLFLFHNAWTLIDRGTGPYFYLAKLENHLEARLWNDVFNFAQDYLGLPRGTIRATVLIEHILAAFEMDEILFELKDHSAGLNCGRWDYIFSFIKTFNRRPDLVLPDRGAVTMERHFLKSYVDLLIRTCHRRGVHAIGGMAAQIPIPHDPGAHQRALDMVRKDKLREVLAGHDGTWVVHPGLVPVARKVFDEHMPTPHNIHRQRGEVVVTTDDLLRVPPGGVTEAGLRHNVSVGVQYLEAWIRGSGCVPINHLMEDAATAEISRSQVWQWVRHGVKLDDARVITPELVREIIQDEVAKVRARQLPHQVTASALPLAARVFEEMITASPFTGWLTTTAYRYLD